MPEVSKGDLSQIGSHVAVRERGIDTLFKVRLYNYLVGYGRERQREKSREK